MGRTISNVSVEMAQIRLAKGSLQKFRLKLLRPSVATLEDGAGDLAMALDFLQQVEPVLASRDRRSAGREQTLELEVADLRRELQQVNALLEGAGNFYQGWSRLLSSGGDDGAANYTPTGQPGVPVLSQSNNVGVIRG